MRADVVKHLGVSVNASLPLASSEAAADLREKAYKTFPFLPYAVHNVLYHSDAADGLMGPQNRFIKEFPL